MSMNKPEHILMGYTVFIRKVMYKVLVLSLHQCRILWYHWGRVTYICISKLTIIGSDDGLSPDRPQAIIWTNAGLLLIGPLGTNFSETLIKILTFSFKKMHLKLLSAKKKRAILSRPHCVKIFYFVSAFLWLPTIQALNGWHLVVLYKADYVLDPYFAKLYTSRDSLNAF